MRQPQEYGRRGLASFGRLSLAAFAVLLALAVLLLGIYVDRFGDAPLFLLILPLGLAAIGYGLRGGLSFGLFTSLLAAVWWIDNGQPGGEVWIASRALTCLAIGALLGWFVDSRQALLRRLAHHTELSLDLICTAGYDGYFTQLNPAFTRTLGFSREELQARPLLEFVHPDDRTTTVQAIADQTREGREVLNFQNRYLCKDGSYRWLEWTSRPDPKAKELIAVARDITARKRLEETEHDNKRLLEHAVRERTQELQRRNTELEDARQETLQRLALAAEYRDDDTHRHTERVGRTAALIAKQFGLPDTMVTLLRQAAPLHDVGKLAVSDTVLLKPDTLTPSEFDHVKRHAEIGATILAGSQSDILQMAEEIARAHHEWWDGSGYPNGLHGNQIPLTARIVALADVYDALTHERPYKAAWPIERALTEIHRLSGRQFDPAIVNAFDQLNPRHLTDQTRPTPPTRHPQLVDHHGRVAAGVVAGDVA